MDEQNKTKPEENQNKPAELSDKDLEQVSGGLQNAVQNSTQINVDTTRSFIGLNEKWLK